MFLDYIISCLTGHCNTTSAVGGNTVFAATKSVFFCQQSVACPKYRNISLLRIQLFRHGMLLGSQSCFSSTHTGTSALKFKPFIAKQDFTCARCLHWPDRHGPKLCCLLLPKLFPLPALLVAHQLCICAFATFSQQAVHEVVDHDVMQVSGEAILKALQAAMDNAPSALAARSVLEGFDTAIK